MRRWADIIVAARRHEDLLWHTASYGFNRGFPFVAAFVAAQLLNIAAFGEFVTAITFFATVLMVVDLGLSLSVTSRVANNLSVRPALVPQAVFVGVTMCLALGLVVAVAMLVAGGPISLAMFGDPQMEPFSHAAALYVPMAALAAVLGGGFTGLQQYRTQAAIGFVGGVAYLIAVVTGAVMGGALGSVWGAAAGMAIRATISLIVASRSRLSGGWRASRRDLLAEGKALSAIALPASIAAFAWMPTNAIMLALLLREPYGKVEAGGLGAVLQVFAIVLVLPSLLTQFTLSRLSLISGPDAARRQAAFVVRWGLTITFTTLVFGGLVAIAAPLVMGLFGSAFTAYWPALVIMMGCAVMSAPQGIFSNYLVAAGQHWWRVAHWYMWAAVVLGIQFATSEMTALSAAWAYLGGWIGLTVIQGLASTLDLRRRIGLEQRLSAVPHGFEAAAVPSSPERPRMRVLSLLPVIGHPRDSKRVDMLLDNGMQVEAAAFERPNPVGRALKCPVTKLGRINDGQYLKRVVAILSSLPTVLRMAGRNDIIYASGQDMGLLGVVVGTLSRTPVVLEVGDIRDVQTRAGLSGMVVRSIDRFLSDRVAFVVVTSEKYITGYYRPHLRRDPRYVIVENKLESRFLEAVARSGPDSITRRDDCLLTLGWFGVLRFQWCVDALREILLNSRRPVRVVLAGYSAGGVDLTPLTSLVDKVEYIPSYKSPSDLPGMYDRIDVVWGCYAVSGGHSAVQNSSWARTNRFYEACAFGKPLIVLNGTGDAEPVAALGIGMVLPDSDIAAVAVAIDSISEADLMRWRNALERLPAGVYADVDEARDLAAVMTEVVSASRRPLS
jgi:succinoglycan biosynthesis protein ExoL